MPDPGGAAFYGPKISVQAKDAIGRTWQMSTIQVDFNQPERFGLEYQAADGTRQRPVMIHRALFGSIERFFGVLTEHYAGAFPAWLAPVQVVGIPIRDDHADVPASPLWTRLRAEGIRAEVDASDDRMQKKIRTAQQQKIPFMVIAGDEDVADGTVSFRYRDGSQRNGVPLDEAVRHVVEVVRSRANAGPSAAARRTRARRRTSRSRSPSPRHEPGGARRARAALDAAPDGVHQGRRAATRTAARSTRRRSAKGDDSLVVARGEVVYAVLNLYPYNPGHLLVCPYRHVADYTDLDAGRDRRAGVVHPAGHAGDPAR